MHAFGILVSNNIFSKEEENHKSTQKLFNRQTNRCPFPFILDMLYLYF